MRVVPQKHITVHIMERSFFHAFKTLFGGGDRGRGGAAAVRRAAAKPFSRRARSIAQQIAQAFPLLEWPKTISKSQKLNLEFLFWNDFGTILELF